MSAPVEEDDLAPTETQGYRVGEKKSMSEYAQLDANDESLNKWKASLGVAGASGSEASGPNVTVDALVLHAPTRTAGPIVLDLKNVSEFTKNPVTIKEAAEYSVEIRFKVNHSIVSGLRYIQVVKRSGIKVDKLESMIGSYGPSPQQLSKTFVSEESPSGMLARSGTYHVQSRVTDDDKGVHADFQWTFKLAKEW